MRARVDTIHNRYEETKNTAFDALDQLIADIVKARANGTDQARIEEAWAYQRQAQFIVDYVTSENSRGFHAPAYTPSPAPVPEYTPPPASPTPSPQAPETASAPTTP